MSELHPSIISLVSLAAGIASKHPDMGLCQLSRLREMGINEEQIESVIEVARHIRDEAAQKIDLAFDEKACSRIDDTQGEIKPTLLSKKNSCCSVTANGHSCC